MTPKKARQIAAAISVKLNKKPQVVVDAIMIAIKEACHTKRGICKICGRIISYDEEWDEAVKEYYRFGLEYHPTSSGTIKVLSAKQYARRVAGSRAAARVICRKCEQLTDTIKCEGTRLAQFFGAIAMSNAISSGSSNQ